MATPLLVITLSTCACQRAGAVLLGVAQHWKLAAAPDYAAVRLFMEDEPRCLAHLGYRPASMSPLPPEFEYDLYLFVAGTDAKSLVAQRNIQKICNEYLSGRYSLEVVDVQAHPERAMSEELLGLPCLVKKHPGLVRRLVGDLSDRPRVLKALGLPPELAIR